MAILTLTTDYGSSDYYQAALKGALYRLCPQSTVVDISHQVNPFDIVNAAYLLKNSHKSFPLGSIHIVCVDNGQLQGQDFLLLEEKGQYFIGRDNGVFSLVFEERLGSAIRLNTKNIQPFVLNNYLGRIAKHVIDKKPLEELGEKITSIREVLTIQPVISPNEIRASIAHIDHYGNAITNLHQTLFESIWEHRSFNIFLKKGEELNTISNNFDNAPIGELVAKFNDSGYLIVGINMGNAASLLSLKKDDIIQIEFKD